MRTGAMGVMAAVVALTTVAVAETNRVEQRFTFKVMNGSQAGASGEGRLELVVNRWSTDAERDRVLSDLREKGPGKLVDAIRKEYAVGYLHWPGHQDYTLRYASRVVRSDGGEDVIVATDWPVRMWWDLSRRPDAPDPVVIQLRLDQDGRGEGKLSTKVVAPQGEKTLVLDDFATLPSILIDVQRERSSTDPSSRS